MARIVLVIALLSAIVGNAQTAAKPSTTHKQTVLAATGKDAQIEKAIRARFAKSKIAADNYEVHVQGGVATITGKTQVVQRKGTATRLAKAAGAERVVNQIEVDQQAKEKAARGLTESRKRVQVKHVPAGDPR
jgi:osmotically-inducible protein OsmY